MGGLPALPSGRKFLFGIGINSYKHCRNLKNAVKDLDDIVNLLVDKYDFERENVTLLIDEEATFNKIINKLHDFTNPNKLGVNDGLLIYFSGHGYLDSNKDGYWVPVESEPGNIASLIPNETVLSKIRKMKCRHVLLISDSCFSGSLLAEEKSINSEKRVADELEGKESRWIITSGRPDEKVLDSTYTNGENSPFAASMLSELQHNNKSKLLTDALALTVRENTSSNALQIPQFGKLYGAGDMGGRFVFTLRDPEPGAWELAQKENTIDLYIQFLAEYPNSNHSNEARERIDALQSNDKINPEKEAERIRKLSPEEQANELLNRRLIESVLEDSQPLLSFKDWQTIKRHRSNIKDWGPNKLLKENLLDKSGRHWRIRIGITLVLLYIGLGFSAWWQSPYGQVWQLERTLHQLNETSTEETKLWVIRTLSVIGEPDKALAITETLIHDKKKLKSCLLLLKASPNFTISQGLLTS